MTPEQARRVIFEVLADIAPEVDESMVDDQHDLTEQLDLDSMDCLNWMVGINEETGVDIPSATYPSSAPSPEQSHTWSPTARNRQERRPGALWPGQRASRGPGRAG